MRWEPQEYIGLFSKRWYYLGTYSLDEPVSLTKEEFKQLSQEVSAQKCYPTVQDDDAVLPRTRRLSLSIIEDYIASG